MRRTALSSVLLCALSVLLLLIGGAAGFAQGTPTPFVEPVGCQPPPDDYSRLWLNGEQLNGRTVAMLDHAQALYSSWGGTLDFRQAVTQGSYTGGALAASFGTHDGGGAVDLAVRSPVDGAVLVNEIDWMLRALRLAGFAAWLRDNDELYPGSVIHIHAIAIGDAELSDEARAQITGRFGYLRGYNGLPQPNGLPIPDRYGGPVLCGWMLVLGLNDLRGSWNPYPTPGGTTVPRLPVP